MKLIIAGSRTGFTKEYVHAFLDSEVDIGSVTEIVSGGARGVDLYGESWAYLNNIDVARFPADWKKYGKSAGYRRNTDMGRYADGLLAFWDGRSKGTKHMIDIMEDLKKPVVIVLLDLSEESEEPDDE